MMPSRRDFLRTSSHGLFGVGLSTHWAAERLLDPALFGMTPDGVTESDARAFALIAVDAARAAGAQYADVRLSTSTYQVVVVDARIAHQPRRSDSFHYGVRALVNGVWGFAAGTEATNAAVAAVAQRAVNQARTHNIGGTSSVELAPLTTVAQGRWQTPIKRDPFAVSFDEQVELMLAANEAVLSIPGVNGAQTRFDFLRDERTFASTDGALTTQLLYWALPFIGGAQAWAATADRSRAAARGVEFDVSGLGYEAIDGLKPALIEAGHDAVAMLSARTVDVGRYDLVMHGRGVASPLAGTLGRALQLDRALGYEANAGGTTFMAPPEDVLGKMKVGNDMLTVSADRSEPGTAAAVKWDDEGVEPRRVALVQNGVVVDYQTNRQMAARVGTYYRSHDLPVHSNGCASALLAYQIPMINMPNLIMAPGPEDVTVDDLIKDTKKGLFFRYGSGGSVDHQQLNGQYSAGIVQEIRDGEIVGYVRDVAYQFRTPEFWTSMDTIGGPSTFVFSGSSAGKGQPNQVTFQSIGAVAARFKQVNVINTGRRG